jgi:hypothetical protein
MEFVPTLQKKYKEEVVPALMKEFGYKSIMQVPRLEKIVLNQGLGASISDKKLMELATEEISNIAGQKLYRPFPARTFQILNSGKKCLLVYVLHYVNKGCMNFWNVLS